MNILSKFAAPTSPGSHRVELYISMASRFDWLLAARQFFAAASFGSTVELRYNLRSSDTRSAGLKTARDLAKF